MEGDDFIEYVFGIYANMYTETTCESLCWISNDKDKNLPIDLVDILMDILPEGTASITLLDTADWLKNGKMNWPILSQFENICDKHNACDFYRKKFTAFLNLNYYK